MPNPFPPLQNALRVLVTEAQVLPATGDKKAAQAQLREIEAEVDRAAAGLWGLTEEELADIQASLRELKG